MSTQPDGLEISFSALFDTHAHEEKLRGESMRLIENNHELAHRLDIIQRAMAVVLRYTLDHTARTADESTMQLLGIRLFNAGASGTKLALSGYYQTAFQQARDIMETGYLLDFFRTSPHQIGVWRTADRPLRRKLFDPVKIRTALDERDGDVEKRRAKQYGELSELASHASYRGFRLTVRGGVGELGPFVEEINLKAWLHEMVLRFGPSAVMYANQFPDAEESLEHELRVFGTMLVQGYKAPVGERK